MRLKYWTILLTGLLANIGTAQAVPTLWVEDYDPTDIFLRANNSDTRTQSFTLDIRDEFEGTPGFRPGVDSLSAAALFLWFYDDLDVSSEQVSLRFDGGSWGRPKEVDGNFLLPDILVFSPLTQLADGILNVSLTATRGDFFFDRAFLTAFGDRSEAVSEPSTLALLAVGVVALGLQMRRRRIAAVVGAT